MIKYMNIVGAKARRAFEKKVNTVIKNKVLSKYVELLGKEKKLILKQNLKDVNYAKKLGVKNNLINRLLIDENKLKDIQNFVKKWNSKKNLVFVTHQVVISNSVNETVSSGELVVTDKNFKVLARIPTL